LAQTAVYDKSIVGPPAVKARPFVAAGCRASARCPAVDRSLTVCGPHLRMERLDLGDARIDRVAHR
jgi:hypothetical protein